MEENKIKDVTATTVGGIAGLDMLVEGIMGLLDGNLDNEAIKKTVFGIVTIVLGFFSFRNNGATMSVNKTFCVVAMAGLLSGCASLVEKCHEFSKYVDIKAIDCAEEKPQPKP